MISLSTWETSAIFSPFTFVSTHCKTQCWRKNVKPVVECILKSCQPCPHAAVEAVWHLSPDATVRRWVFSSRKLSDNICLFCCHLGTSELGLLTKRDRHITETKRQNTRKSEREKDTREKTETDSLWTHVIGCLSKWPSEFTSHCDDCRWRNGKGRAIERWSSYSDWNVTRERTYANS